LQGGTALSRAHRLIERMSEDIDIKIVSEGPPPRPALRRLRERIAGELLKAGFKFDPRNPKHLKSNYESRYSVWPLRRAPIELPVISFLAEAFKRPPEVPAIACAAIEETAAEKFVALTRRAGAVLAGAQSERDPTLVRHIYDLHAIREHYEAADVAALACKIMHSDAETYGHQFPAYRNDPLAESLRAVEGVAADADFAGDYTNFRRDMVYGEAPDFETAIATLKKLAAHLDPGRS
jgi:Nucleotidyl transferase AbiEii toxin, Type IV TA system